MIKIKICGVTNMQDALAATNLGADYIGFNFYAPSPRKVSPKNAKDIVAKLPSFVQPVGIFVDEATPAIAKLVKSVPLKVVQLHGAESPDACREVKALGVQVIKVFSLQGPLDPTELSLYQDAVDFFMFDSSSNDAPGGTGQAFDWNWLAGAAQLGKPWVLAGGLTPENIGAAIKAAQPSMVDVCSGVERLPSRKDFEAMKKFITDVRSAK